MYKALQCIKHLSLEGTLTYLLHFVCSTESEEGRISFHVLIFIQEKNKAWVS